MQRQLRQIVAVTLLGAVAPMTAPITAAVTGTIATTFATPAAAQGYRSPRGVRVNQVSNILFEAIGSSSQGSDFWCAASDYARRYLGAGWSQQIYVARGMGPSVTTNRRSAVHFTLDPGAAGVTPLDRKSLSANRFTPGDSMSVQVANTYCRSFPTRF